MDERVTPIRGNEKADLVFITALTSTAYRAYALADIFKGRGIPVVMGGVHVTALPEEAREHATTVVIGEAEGVMEQLLSDFEASGLAPEYRSSCFTDMKDIPAPSIHLLNWRHRVFLSPIQTSRGCPNSCNFCAVPAISGRKLRLASLSAVEQALQSLTFFRSRKLFVVDDNFIVDKDRALAMMDLFRYYGFKWMGFSNLWISEDAHLLESLRKSGCVSLFIGFESLHGQGRLLKNRAYGNPTSIREAVGRIHSHNIGIQGSFIFGFDEDRPDVFQETAAFIQDTGIELPNISILTPFPGTMLFDALEKENRIMHKNWAFYDMHHTVFRPLNMSLEELQQGYAWALKYLSSPSSILSRLRKRFGPTPYFLVANFSLHRYQTRLAHSLWNRDAQTSLQKRGLCPC
ncbi:MAG: B12-binding domain-containing radical SAM protein [Deltaproteobacteria bacterium]|nr:B12-binding domain-containing radical SAM protein [Deltaproteobacteria bacterium]